MKLTLRLKGSDSFTKLKKQILKKDEELTDEEKKKIEELVLSKRKSKIKEDNK
jgi:hypothetical protein